MNDILRRIHDGDGRIEDIELLFLQPGDERPRFFNVSSVQVSIDSNRIALDADIQLPDDLGRDISVSATHLLDLPVGQRLWDVTVEADNILLPGWSELHPALQGRLLSGNGDIDVSFALSGKSISNASVNLDLADLSLTDEQVFDLGGRFDLDISDDGWLVAADDMRLGTNGHEWPDASLLAEASTDAA